MEAVLKPYRYRLVDNRDFELPLPLKFEILKKDCPIAEYEISENEEVSFRILTKYKEDMLTTVYRPIQISDIYYLFSCRVFQDGTPFTQSELALLGLDKYNVYDILKKTRGITPFDTYWIRLGEDDCDYDRALEEFNILTTPKPEDEKPDNDTSDAGIEQILSQHRIDVEKIASEEGLAPGNANSAGASEISGENVKSILDQHKVDVAKIAAEESAPKEKMSEEEIDLMLKAAGLFDESEEVSVTEPAPVSGGKMSQEDIEKLLSANSAPVEAEAPAEPAAEPAPAAGSKMSQEDIEKLLSANSAPVEAEAPAEPVTEPAPETSGKMSQEDIEKLLSANSAPIEAEAPAEPVTEPAPETSGKMSQEDIEKLLSANSAPVEAEAPEEPVAKPAPETSGKMSEEDIAALLQSMQDEAKK